MTFTYPSHTTKGCVPLSSDVNNLSENELKRLDMICCVAAGTFVCDRGDKTISYCDKSKSLVYFLLKVLGKLQEIGTVPAIDYNAYAQKIEVHQHP